jgi:hypothetical protein
MEEVWIADRSTLRHLLILHPSWTHPQFADCLHRSLSWVKKWRKHFSQADPTDLGSGSLEQDGPLSIVTMEEEEQTRLMHQHRLGKR